MAFIGTAPSATTMFSVYDLIPVRFIETAVGTYYKYRFIVRIKDYNGGELGTLTMKPSIIAGTAQGTINLAEFLQAHMEDFDGGTSFIVSDSQGSKGGTGARKFLIDIGYRSSTTEGGTVTTTYDSTDNIVFGMLFRRENNYGMSTSNAGDIGISQLPLVADNSRPQTESPASNTDILAANGFYSTNWADVIQYTNYVNDNSYRTLSVILGSNTSGWNFGSSADRIAIKLLNGTTQVSSDQVFTFATQSGVASDDVNADDELQYFFGVGPQNLRNWTGFDGTIKAALAAGTWTDLLVQYFEGTPSSANARSGVMVYRRANGCNDLNEVVTLCFVNRVGGWDAIDFTGKLTRQNASESELTYTKQSASFNSYATPTQLPYESGDTIVEKRYRDSITITSDWVRESENVLFQSLFVSSRVLVRIPGVANSAFIPYRITDKQWTRKTIANDKLIRYTLNLTGSNYSVT